MSKTTNRIITALFSVFIGGFFVLNLLLPDKTFSEKENRQLQTLPKFSFSSLFSGSFATRFESYCSDQFAGRDIWIETKAGAELAQGKQQNNGVFLCVGDRLLEPFTAPETDTLTRAVQAADSLSDAGVPVSLAIIPTAAQLYADILPEGAENDDQKSVIDGAYSQTALETVDISSVLAAHAGEYIFYRTDHHWTSEGAYLAYEQFAGSKGLPLFDRSDADEKKVENFYGTSYSKARNYDVVPDTITYYDLPNQLTVYTANADGSESGETGPLYNTADFETRDKYKAFLRGNNGYSVLEGNGTGSILIIKDSYANAFIPYLVEDYASIGIVDFRYLNEKVDSLIERGGYDEILVLFSFQGFMDDMTLAAKIATP